MIHPATLKPNENLSAEQEAAVLDIRAGENVLVTGPAGTGKSTILNFLRETYEDILVTASTGVAAVNVGGNTVHSAFGLGLGKDTAEQIAYKIVERGGPAMQNIYFAKIIAIDEISMLDGHIFEKLSKVFQLVRKDPRPFGGVQVVLFGDFCQLAPVTTENEEPFFAFESKAWKDANIKTHMLTHVFRQEERAFATALSHLRIGQPYHSSFALITGRIGEKPPEGIRPVRIFCHNLDVDRLNEQELEKIEGEIRTYKAEEWGKSKTAAERLRKDCLAPQNLRLKKDAQVMLLVNLDAELGLVNGSMGKAVEFTDESVRVEFFNGLKVWLGTHTWKIADGETTLAERSQIPLRLAYSVTSHKAQGMSLDYVECDLARVFDYGQAYVALSRARRLQGLYIRSLNPHRIRAHPKALEFYGIKAA